MKLFLILLNIFQIHAYWESIFSDEFNETILDHNKWLIQNEQEPCGDNLIKELHCNTNSRRNVRLIDGTLALTAIREQHLNKEYTSSIINTKDNFTFGKFEIRAALPSGKMLRPIVSLKPTTRSGKWPDDGEVVIFTNRENNILEFGIYFTFRGRPKYAREKISIATNLRDFHTYVLEWNQNELSLKFDGIRLTIIDFFRELKDSPNPFLKPFTLSVGVGVGGVVFNKQELTAEDANEWNCSALIVDYIRIYRWIEDRRSATKNEPIVERDNKSSVDICNAIMEDIRSGSIQNNELETEVSTKDTTHTTLSTEFSTLESTHSFITDETHSMDSVASSTSIILGQIKLEDFLENYCPRVTSSIQVYLITIAIILLLIIE